MSAARPWLPWAAAALGLGLGLGAVLAVPDRLFFPPPAAAGAGAGHAGERWACPMLDYIGNAPGACPVCGMTLQLVTAGELSREQAKRMGVALATVEEGPAVMTVRAYGAARYDDRSERVVIPRVAGRVVRRHGGALHAGLLVQAGDPLVDLYSPEAFAAQGELAAALRLGDPALIGSVRARFARWNLAHVAAAIEAGGEPVDTITIRSPFAGRTVADEAAERAGGGMVLVGAELMPDQPLLRLVDPHAFMVVVHVPEPQARLLRAGQAVRIASDDAGELDDVQAQVSWVAPELDAALRARPVHLHLSDPRDRLLAGSLVSARVQVALAADGGPADAGDPATWGRFVLVPASAVLSTGVRSVAWRLTGTAEDGRQRFAIAPLALGQRLESPDGEDRYVVRAGLAAGDRVAARGAFLIDSQAQLAGSPSLLFPLGATAPDAGHRH